MGNDQSQLPGIEIEEKAIEVSDFWTQHSASVLNSEAITNLSVFISELFVDGSLWSIQTPLEKCSKNFMIYRHPCIIKYVSSWQKNSKFYLAVEEVTPLSHVLPALNTLQICIGLHSILKALVFLHEKASASHNNVCISSIYITKDGSWKLGGMEYLCRYSDLSCDYLKKSKIGRYDKAIDSNEEKHFQNSNCRKDFIDVFAFGVLAYEILKLKSNNLDDIPNLTSFCDYCQKELQNSNISQRPKLSSILEHEFFNHEFINIHSFLVELPLKTDDQKTLFFLSLKERLKKFDEIVIASQLSGLLLSRMVLLNKTAQESLLPSLLTPCVDQETQADLLFSEETFKKYISPKLLEIMSVRDAQIRLLLLNHFSSFLHTFSKEELQSCILPELLLGIKDTNDNLVAVTLKTLADLVLILGAATVIGGKRAKLFNDGKPTTHSHRKSIKLPKCHETEVQILPPELFHDQIRVSSSIIESNNLIALPERSRPDGEEGETSTDEVEQSVDEDMENWEDWDINEMNSNSNNVIMSNADTLENGNEIVLVVSDNQIDLEETNRNEESRPQRTTNIKRTIPDIAELDIKNQLNRSETDDFDFFQDMEPVINTTNKFLVNESKCDINNLDKEVSSKLALNDNDVNEEGWGDGDWE